MTFWFIVLTIPLKNVQLLQNINKSFSRVNIRDCKSISNSSDKKQTINLSCCIENWEGNFCINYGIIGWMDNQKILSFNFSQCSGFKIHAAYLWYKISKRTNIMKTLAIKKYGSWTQCVITSVQSSICTLTSCGAHIHGNAGL